MNASSWKKAADIVTNMTPYSLQASAAATAELQNLQSLLLSALSIDDSGPPKVTDEPQQPIASSTPQATQAALSHTRVQTNPTVERGPSWIPKIKKLPRDKAAEKGNQTKDKEK